MTVPENFARAKRLAPDEALLELDGVDVTYEEAAKPVLRDISLSVAPGESVLFLGPSGCGKSTLAMVCAGLLPGVVEGEVLGHVRRSDSLADPGSVGYVFQDADAQFCMLTAADEIAFGLENRQLSRGEMPRRIEEALATAGLGVPFDSNHAAFSGGMKQKLAIASALAMEAQLLIFDEPTANLDPQSTREVFDQIAGLHDAGRTLIVIEHKFEPLVEHMDRAVLFTESGQIHRIGPARQVIAEEWPWLVETGVARASDRWQTPIAREMVTVRTSAVSTAHSDANSEGVKGHVLSLRAGSLTYGDNAVWSNVSLDIQAGAITAIVGPNGAGKSSLLQVLAGLQKPASGAVLLHGRPYTRRRRDPQARAVAFCFQNPEYQFIFERVADEMANRVLDGDLPEAAQAVLDELGLADAGAESPFALSQGQKRRLSVAVMLRDDHDAYLLDEPTFGQDARTEAVIMNRLCALRDAGKSIVISTHDLSLVARYVDRVVVLAEGGLLFDGSPNDLFADPGVMARAHLLDDQAAGSARSSSSCLHPGGVDQETRMAAAMPAQPESRGRGLQLNPPLLLVTIVAAALAAVFANHLPQAIAVFAWPLVLMVTLFRMNPWQVLKRLSAFVLFYILYTWSYIAFTRVPPGTPVIHILWMHPSLSGLITGLVLAFRMLAAVALGILFVSNTNLTDLMVGWSQNFRVKPKFTYGMLAGMHFLPMFRTEWVKLRQARQLRGRDASFAPLRIVTYALPILSQAIRLSERVAIAMEARGLTGPAAIDAGSRTYFRDVPLRRLDFWFASFLVASMIALLVVFP